jgi:hypothetical protein
MRRVAMSAAILSIALIFFSCGGPIPGRGPVRVWLIPTRQPQVRVTLTRGCPVSISRYQDVRNAGVGSHDRLVPLNPREGLICRYGPRVLLGGSGESGPERYRRTALDKSQADDLASVIDHISTAGPGSGPPPACPEDSGSASIIAFAYVSGPDADLWYRDAGCQMLDNGTIGAWEEGNPSFYNGFISTIDALSPLQT